MKSAPLIQKSWRKGVKKFAIIYPNKQFGGVYNLAIHIIYNLVNNQPNWICEQRFIEDATNLDQFDLIGFTWQYELDLKNIIKILAQNKIKGKIFAGGPCVNTNFNPIKKYVDFLVLGECEEILPQILENYDDLDNLSKIPGVYVPSLTKKIIFAKNTLDSYPFYQPIPVEIDKKFVFGKCFILEVERGCPFKCNFCPLPCNFELKYRPLEKLKEIINLGLKINQRNKIVIYAPSFTHPQKKEILQYLIDKKVNFTVPSIKAEYMDKETLELIYKGGQKSLTIAPECGETLRPTLNKHVKDEKYLAFAKAADKFSKLKLYFMLGLPEQNKKDMNEILSLIKNIKKVFRGNIYASFNPFIPKKGTKFEDQPFRKKEILSQIEYLKKHLDIQYKFSGVATAEKIYKMNSI